MTAVKVHAVRWKQLLAFMLVVIAMVVGMTKYIQHADRQAVQRIYQTQLASCGRGNVTRGQIDLQIQQSITQRGVLLAFIGAARLAWENSYKRTHSASDLRTAQNYSKLSNRLIADVHYRQLKLINCQATVKRP